MAKQQTKRVSNIPASWEAVKLSALFDITSSKRVFQHEWKSEGVPFYRAREIVKLAKNGSVENELFISEDMYQSYKSRYGVPKVGDLLITGVGTVGHVYRVRNNSPFYFKDGNIIWFKSKNKVLSSFIEQLYKNPKTKYKLLGSTPITTVATYTIDAAKKSSVSLPPLPEQKRIVQVLETWDYAIEALKKKIEYKKKIKKGLMQELLSGKKRLLGFSGKWHAVRLRDISINMDNMRVPINSNDRSLRKGLIPYCGANGIVDYIDDFIFDEDIILIAEDGGQFDEYQNRPIAYRMKEKCWVNNHAHVIKASNGFSQDLLFYLTVHKNILKYLNGGTRAKLNKSELSNIEYFVPESKKEQAALADILILADKAIIGLQKKLLAYKKQKKFLLNNLITGDIRTPELIKVKE